MYVCICNAIRENELRCAARSSLCDVEDIYARMGKRPQCSQCLEEAEEIVSEERSRAALPQLQAA